MHQNIWAWTTNSTSECEIFSVQTWISLSNVTSVHRTFSFPIKISPIVSYINFLGHEIVVVYEYSQNTRSRDVYRCSKTITKSYYHLPYNIYLNILGIVLWYYCINVINYNTIDYKY